MKLTYPKSHATEDLRPLYDEYRTTYPAQFEEWLRLEGKGRELGMNELFDVQSHIYDFLRQRAEPTGHQALREAFVDFRMLILKDHPA